MTRKIGNTVVIEVEPDRTCSICGRKKECRPYGQGGAQVCFDCAMSTPERKAEAERRLAALFDEKE